MFWSEFQLCGALHHCDALNVLEKVDFLIEKIVLSPKVTPTFNEFFFVFFILEHNRITLLNRFWQFYSHTILILILYITYSEIEKRYVFKRGLYLEHLYMFYFDKSHFYIFLWLLYNIKSIAQFHNFFFAIFFCHLLSYLCHFLL